MKWEVSAPHRAAKLNRGGDHQTQVLAHVRVWRAAARAPHRCVSGLRFSCRQCCSQCVIAVLAVNSPCVHTRFWLLDHFLLLLNLAARCAA